ncbi:MAG: PAS domain-containing hybrid sensor histidine kinase/response regulator [Vicinamibacterales bacterium]
MSPLIVFVAAAALLFTAVTRPGSFTVTEPAELLRVALSVAAGAAVVVAVGRLRTARRPAAPAGREANAADAHLHDALREARRENQELRTLLDVAPVGIAVARDPECRHITMSAAFASMLGITEEDNVSQGRPDPENLRVVIMHNGLEVPAGQLPMQIAGRTGRLVRDFEYDVRLRDGSERHFLVNAAPLFDGAGAVRGVLGVHVDITARRNAEDRLRVALQQVNAHIESSPLAIVEWDADFVITRWSRKTEQMFGWPANEAVGRRIDALPLVYEEDWDSVHQVMADMLANRRPQNLNVNRNRRKDGEVIHCEWYNSAIFDGAGRMISVLSQVLDVSDRVRAEVECERWLAVSESARLEAERANRAKDEFLAVLSHELRAPLQAMTGWLQMLERDSLDDDVRRRGLAVIRRGAHLQTQLIQDMLDVSRVATGKFELSRQAMDLARVAQHVVEQLAPLAEEREITLTSDISPSLIVLGDRERLTQVLSNLVSNALKFTGAGGKVDVTCHAADTSVVVKVSDTGEGLDSAEIPYIFERFRQGDAGTTRRHGGLGIGLALVDHIVTIHGGSVAVESAGKGYGATFTVTLPRLFGEPMTVKTVEETLSPGRPLAGRQILCVEDHDDSRELLEIVLAEAGASVVSAQSVAEAEQRLADSIDAVLTDLSMPGSDGYGLAVSVRSRYPGLPIVALTGLAAAADRERALSAGFNAMLVKPAPPDLVIETLSRVLAARP